jgi:predicted ATPase
VSESALRSLQAVRAVTVTIASGNEHRGQGLLIDLGKTGTYVLTCHHITSQIEPRNLRVVIPGTGKRAQAMIVAGRSRPQRDAMVLRVKGDPRVEDQPRLHALADGYTGSRRATCLVDGTALGTPSFDARIAEGGPLSVPGRGDVERYKLPIAFQLVDTTDAREGISGAVVWCEKGVVGLVHFARAESDRAARLAFMNPLSAWAKGWPALARRVHPFVDDLLFQSASIVGTGTTQLQDLLVLHPELVKDVYVRRACDTWFEESLRRTRQALLLGKEGSGKSRVVFEYLRRRKSALVVVPKTEKPPAEFETSTFEGEVVVLVDNLDVDSGELAPAEWWQRFETVSQKPFFIVTCRDGRDWTRVRRDQRGLVARLERAGAIVPTSGPPPKGGDLTKRAGRELARRLSLSSAQFDRRFDGTPGSLLAPESPADGQPELPAGELAGVAVDTLSRPKGARKIPTNLPSFSSTFVERKRERRELEDLITRARLVTIWGPAGVGKTRLALQLATDLLGSFPDGVWVADLSFQRLPEVVPQVITASMGVSELSTGTPLETLTLHLRDKKTLLVLNGCDHVHGVAAEVAAEVLKASSEARILTTVRKPLGVPGEAAYELHPLPTAKGPRQESGAMALFVDRVRERRGKKALSRDDYAAIEKLLRSVGGNPLAIELLANHAGRVGPQEAASEIDDLTGAEAGDESAASQEPSSVEATIDVVSDALGPAETTLFEATAVFAGGFGLEGLRSVGQALRVDADEIPDLLRSLIDRRLVLIDKRGSGADRYRLLESIREQARSRLAADGLLARAERAHGSYYVGLAEKASGRKGQPQEASWFDRLDRDIENVRAALSWTLEKQDWKIAQRAGTALWWFWYQRSHLAEGRRWLRDLRTMIDRLAAKDPKVAAPSSARAELLNGAGNFASQQGDFAEAESLHRAAYEMREALGDRRDSAGSLNNLALVERRRGNATDATRLLEEALDISRSFGNAFWEAMHLNNLGLVLREWVPKQRQRASSCQQGSLTICARLGANWGMAQALSALGTLATDDGSFADARRLFERSKEIRLEIGNPQGVAESLNGLGRIARLEGNLDAAAARHRDALQMLVQVGDRPSIAETIEALAMALVPSETDLAARLFGSADAIRTSLPLPLPPVEKGDLEEQRKVAQRLLGKKRFTTELHSGRSRTLSETVTEALGSPPQG